MLSEVCLVTAGEDSDSVLPDPSGSPFGLCDSHHQMIQTGKKYDTSKDFLLDHTEMNEELSEDEFCCGGRCPHASWCDGRLYKLFPVQTADVGGTLGSRANMASFHTVWEQMKEHGMVGLVMNVRGIPECCRPPQPTAS